MDCRVRVSRVLCNKLELPSLCITRVSLSGYTCGLVSSSGDFSGPGGRETSYLFTASSLCWRNAVGRCESLALLFLSTRELIIFRGPNDLLRSIIRSHICVSRRGTFTVQMMLLLSRVSRNEFTRRHTVGTQSRRLYYILQAARPTLSIGIKFVARIDRCNTIHHPLKKFL